MAIFLAALTDLNEDTEHARNSAEYARSASANYSTNIGIYHLLAPFGILVTITWIILSISLSENMTKSFRSHIIWNKIHENSTTIQLLARNVNVPAQNAVKPNGVSYNTNLSHSGLRFHDKKIKELNAIIVDVLKPDEARKINAMLSTIKNGFDEKMDQSERPLPLDKNGRFTIGSRLTTGVDQQVTKNLNYNIEQLVRKLRTFEARSESRFLAIVITYRWFEYFLACIIFVLFVIVMLFYRKKDSLFKQQLHNITNTNTLQETRVSWRTQDLEQESKDIELANREFRQKLEELEVSRDSLEAHKQALWVQNNRFKAVIDNIPHGIVWFDSMQRLVICNDHFARMFQLPEKLSHPGTSLESIFEHRYETGSFVDSLLGVDKNAYLRSIADRNSWHKTVELGDGRHLSIRHTPMPDGGSLGTHTDVTERRMLEKQIVHLALHDPLTGILNRRGFEDHISRAIPTFNEFTPLSILCIDLDGFKEVNDTHGHPIGDKVLQVTTRRLVDCISHADVAARLGGDEFAIVLCHPKTAEEVEALAQKVVEAISKPIVVGDRHTRIGASIGYAISPDDGDSVETLLRNVDIALYRAKSDGRGLVRRYVDGMDGQARDLRKLKQELNKALALNQFTLHYQPLIDVPSLTVRGFEALIRWSHPERGLLSPAEFIPIAEDSGLIGAIGGWALTEACIEASRWPDDIQVAVNVSPKQFSDNSVVQDVVSAISTSQIESQRLVLEITESVILEDTTKTLNMLNRLRQLGVCVALDDFGTGYSSLSYLSNFLFDKIKIDRSFIQAAEKSRTSMAVIRAVIGLSREIGMTTTAEGIETNNQFELIRREGCTEIQGYYFSKPILGSEIPAYLKKFAREKYTA